MTYTMQETDNLEAVPFGVIAHYIRQHGARCRKGTGPDSGAVLVGIDWTNIETGQEGTRWTPCRTLRDVKIELGY